MKRERERINMDIKKKKFLFIIFVLFTAMITLNIFIVRKNLIRNKLENRQEIEPILIPDKDLSSQNPQSLPSQNIENSFSNNNDKATSNQKENGSKQENSGKENPPPRNQNLDLSCFSEKDLLIFCKQTLLEAIERCENDQNSSLRQSKAAIFKKGLNIFTKKMTDEKICQLLRSSKEIDASDPNVSFSLNITKRPKVNFDKRLYDFSGTQWRKSSADEKCAFNACSNFYAWGDWQGGKGNGLDEIMVQCFPAVALLASKFNPYWWKSIPDPQFNPKIFTRKPEGIDKGSTSSLTSSNSAHPFLLTNFRCFFDIDVKQEGNKIIKTFDNPERVDIINMAAPQLKPWQRNDFYQESTISDLLSQVITAFNIVKLSSDKAGKKSHIHTTRWGADIFKHNFLVSAFCQYVGAVLNEIDEITFVCTSRNEQTKINTFIEWIENFFKTNSPKISSCDLVKALFDKAKKDNLKTQ